MKGIQFQWVLPIFHLAMDAILVAILIAALRYVVDHPPEAEFTARPLVPVVDQLCYTRFDPRASPLLAGPFLLLVTANAPAGLVLVLALVTAGNDLSIPYGSKGFLWLGLYEILAVPVWLFFGRLPHGRRWGLASIFVRLTAGSIRVFEDLGLGVGLQLLFWLVAAIYSGFWFVRRIRSTKLSSGEQH